jgi:hypothetical protein
VRQTLLAMVALLAVGVLGAGEVYQMAFEQSSLRAAWLDEHSLLAEKRGLQAHPRCRDYHVMT